MTRLRLAPVTVPCAAALVLVAWWAFDNGGFAVRQWAPGGLVLLVLLAAALVVLGPPVRVPRPVVVAASGLVAYTLWSFASVAWADDPGFALEGATRTALYAVTFCLFALWPQHGRTGAALLGAWLAVVTAVGVVLVVRLMGSADPLQLFREGRLLAPAGYSNATAALLMMPVLPAVVVAAARAVPWWARGGSAAAAVLLASLALLTVSRGAVFSAPIALLLLGVLVPGRVRHFYVLLPVCAAVAVCAPGLLGVADALAIAPPRQVLREALEPVCVAALVAGLLVASVARLEGRRHRAGAAVARLAPAARALPAVVLALAVVGGLAWAGNPVDRVDAAWTSFKGGYAENDPTANRLVGGLGSARYDFYRVGLHAWADHPLVGVGADGFTQQYLLRRTSDETPRYPHSVEVRALVQTGAIGAVLLFGALAAAFVAAMRGMRTGGALRRTAAGGATMGFVLWFVHGSVDWFWEWAGLGVPAFALLGLACAMARPVEEPGTVPSGPVARPRRRTAWRAAALVACGAIAVPFACLWAADREQRRATTVFATDPITAYAYLDRARRINPFAAAPETLVGSIALRWGDLTRADAAFAEALDRVPDDQYATLERGAIASALGRPKQAESYLARAVALSPRDRLAREALAIVREGGRVDVAVLNQRIRESASGLTS